MNNLLSFGVKLFMFPLPKTLANSGLKVLGNSIIDGHGRLALKISSAGFEVTVSIKVQHLNPVHSQENKESGQKKG